MRPISRSRSRRSRRSWWARTAGPNERKGPLTPMSALMSSLPFPIVALASMISEERVRAILRQDAIGVALGIVFLTLGLAASANVLRRRTTDPTLLWFGLFSLLFGLRQLALAPTVRFAIGGRDAIWFYP